MRAGGLIFPQKILGGSHFDTPRLFEASVFVRKKTVGLQYRRLAGT
jgi:hypothetical protein